MSNPQPVLVRRAPESGAPRCAPRAPARGPALEPTPAFHFADVAVLAAEPVTPHLRRISFVGERLRDVRSGGRDQSCSVFLPVPGQPAPLLPDRDPQHWYRRWRAADPGQRPLLRAYTVRDARPERAELDVEFALHGRGPAARWAAAAAVGDRATVLVPARPDNPGVRFRPPAGTDWVLLAADLTALPAVAGILSWLPADRPAVVLAQVADPVDLVPLPVSGQARLHWRFGAGRGSDGGLATVPLPPGRGYAWLAGEAQLVRSWRRHLMRDRGFDPTQITLTGYWRQVAR